MITVSTRYPDPITGKIVPKEQAIEEQIDMRFALKNLVHDGLKVGDVLGKRSLAINSTFGHTSIYCNGREVVCFGVVQGPPAHAANRDALKRLLQEGLR